MTELRIGQEEVFPQGERLSDDLLNNLISSVGNHEPKGTLLGSMEEMKIYSRRELYRRFIDIQGERVGWRPGKNLPFDYCQDSLSPIGLVAKEEIDPDLHTWGYGITPLGDKEGKILIGLLLDFSERHPELTLREVLGSTSSRSKPKVIQTPEGETEFKNRAPTVRYKIFWELVTRQLPIKTIDLANAIGEDEGKISQHLTQLAASHIISYEAGKKDQPYSFYKLSSERPIDPPKQHKGYPSLTKHVYNFFLHLYRSKQVTTEEIADSLISATPEMRKLNKKDLRERIGVICSFLTRQHYLEQGKFSHNLHSEITLSDTQKLTLLELVTLLDRFQRQDPAILEEGRRKAIGIINNPERVSSLLKKAKENSGNANSSSLEESSKYILSLIQDRPNTTNTDLFNLQDRKPKLSRGRVAQITQFLAKNNRVAVSKEKTQKHFTAVDFKE